jgi:hypothetical protein
VESSNLKLVSVNVQPPMVNALSVKVNSVELLLTDTTSKGFPANPNLTK